MRKKLKIKYWNRVYIVWELTVWWYFLALSDVEQFIEDIFLEFNRDIPKLDENQLKLLIQKLFNIDDQDLDSLLNTKKTRWIAEQERVPWGKKENPLKDFHIKIWFFMKFFCNSHEQTMKTPLKVFNDLLEDIKIFSWDEKYDPNRKSKNTEKRKLKNLMNNINNNV